MILLEAIFWAFFSVTHTLYAFYRLFNWSADMKGHMCPSLHVHSCSHSWSCAELFQGEVQ